MLFGDVATVDVDVRFARDRREYEREDPIAARELLFLAFPTVQTRIQCLAEFPGQRTPLTADDQAVHRARRIVGVEHLAVGLHPDDGVGILGRELGQIGNSLLAQMFLGDV